LPGRPFDRNGISYLDIDWPVHQGSAEEGEGLALDSAARGGGGSTRSERPAFRYLF
jgi:hypothetical protein